MFKISTIGLCYRLFSRWLREGELDVNTLLLLLLRSAVGELIADIFGSSDEEEEFEASVNYTCYTCRDEVDDVKFVPRLITCYGCVLGFFYCMEFTLHHW